MPLVLANAFGDVLLGIGATLAWTAWAVLNFWVWRTARAGGNLTMTLGSAYLAVDAFVAGIAGARPSGALHLAALVVLTAGFYLSVAPMVRGRVEALAAKVGGLLRAKGVGAPGAPSPPPAPPPALPPA